MAEECIEGILKAFEDLRVAQREFLGLPGQSDTGRQINAELLYKPLD